MIEAVPTDPYGAGLILVDENMKRAHNRDGLLSTKFWWKVPSGPEPTITNVAPLNQTQFLRSSDSHN